MLLTAMLLVSCGPVRNYDQPDEPFYEGHYAVSGQEPGEYIKIVTWNLSFAENLDPAIEALSQVDVLKDADILLLQEMDEVGVERIAEELAYNYVYYPASVHRRHNKNFGNAVLTRWEIIDHEKIRLPKTGPGNKHSRNAIKAKIMVSGLEVIAFSIHLETFWFMQAEEQRQAAFLANHVKSWDELVFIGGDFNSLTKGSIKYLEKSFGQVGLRRLSKNTGYTFKNFGLKLTLDHIFSSKVSTYETGVWRGSVASDHFPVWSVSSLDDV
jgi:endonuclease/exonuclease/phosphatase family metal-dependent hydrolase